MTIPMLVGLVVLRTEITRTLFQRGAFDTADTYLTAYAVGFYGLGLLFFAWRELLNRAFFALQDTWTPTYIAVASVAVNIAANLLLLRYLGHGVLALGASVAAFVATGTLLLLLRKKLGYLGGQGLLISTAKSGLAAVVMGVVVEVMRRNHVLIRAFGVLSEQTSYFDLGLLPTAAEVIALAVIGATIYFAIAHLLRVKELDQSWRLVRQLAVKALSKTSPVKPERDFPA